MKLPDPHGGRSVEEWIGKTPDTAVPDRVRDRVLLRYGSKCYLTGLPIDPTKDKWQLDHKKELRDGGENRESNLAPALDAPHKIKSAIAENRQAKADRIRRKHNGTWPKAERPLKGRGFAKRGQLWQKPSTLNRDAGD